MRQAVTRFYTLLMEHKFREAEALIVPESRDAYYEAEKPSIQDFEIRKVAVDPDGKSAIVTIASHSRMRRPMFTGEITLKTGQESHWVLRGGNWMWIIVKSGTQQTPFGEMRVDADQARQSGVDPRVAIARGPKPAELPAPFTVDKRDITLAEGAVPEVVTITNKLPGVVQLSFRVAGGSGFECTLRKNRLATGESTELLVYRSKVKKELVSGVIAIDSYPIPQTIEIHVKGATGAP